MRSAVLVVLVGVLALAAPAQAHHTPVPGVVALVGSLQSELGCPGDWQPECVQTRLQPVAGSPGVFRGTFDVPAGAFEYKVALNNSWDENYGAGGAAGGANIALDAPGGELTFTYDHATHVIGDDAPVVLGRQKAAHWLRRGLLAWEAPEAATYRLHTAPEGGLELQDGAIVGGDSYPLTPVDTPVPDDFPHLAAFDTFELSEAGRRAARELLTGQLIVAAYDAAGEFVGATGVQIPGVLDDLYAGAAGARLGPTWRGRTPRLAVWAPTAKDVQLVLGERRLAMDRGRDGVWRIEGRPSWRNAEYAYAVTVYVPDEVVTNVVTDPYSLGLTLNSRRSLLVDLDDRELAPRGWDRLRKPELDQPEDSTIYELHVRDFSITDETVPSRDRGTYRAFTHADSDGMRHLRRLAGSGMNSLHLLPTNDIATIEEDRSRQQEPPCDLASFPPDSEQQQACIGLVKDADGFNWGYDPLHYTTPEGSYSTRPDGTARTREFREMVMGVNRAGLRVVMDVVYNHTPAAGQDPKSILDRIVPGYYHRLNPATGAVETSTCCSNTATEHRMMEKLMVESIVTWAREYKVDGFRFDLMGHHSKANMLNVRRALDSLTLRRDGVDGRRIYVYGEGWNFGEVANNARFVQASQLNMAGTGIGTFSDRLRDAVRGGGPFDEDPRIQGFASGLFTDPNGARGQRHGGAAAREAAAAPRPDQGRPHRQPARLPVRRPHRPDRHRRAGRLQRPARRLRRRAGRDDHLRRRARQRDAVRRPAVQAPARDLDGRPGADEHGRAVDRRARAVARLLARRHRPPALQVARPQQLQLGRLVQPDRLERHRVHVGIGPAAARGQRVQVGLHAAAARRAGARAVAGPHPHRPRPRRRAAADPLLVAAVPARQRARDPAARELPNRRAGPDARRDRDGDRGPRRHRGGLQRDAGPDHPDHPRARPLRAAPGAGPGRRPGGADVDVPVRRLVHGAGPDDRGVRRALVGYGWARRVRRTAAGWGAATPPVRPVSSGRHGSVVDFYNGSRRNRADERARTAADSAREGRSGRLGAVRGKPSCPGVVLRP